MLDLPAGVVVQFAAGDERLAAPIVAVWRHFALRPILGKARHAA